MIPYVTVRNRKLGLDEEIVEDYEKVTGNKVTDELAEFLLSQSLLTADTSNMSDDAIVTIIDRELCLDTYVPKIQIPVFNDTKILSIDRRLAVYFAEYENLHAKRLENYLELTEPRETEHTVKFMSNRELSKRITETMIRRIREMNEDKVLISRAWSEIFPEEKH